MTDVKDQVYMILIDDGDLTIPEIINILYPESFECDKKGHYNVILNALGRLIKWERVEIVGQAPGVNGKPRNIYGIRRNAE